MEKLKVKFPEGLEYIIPFNTTIFVEESIHEVYKTLFEAGVLVLDRHPGVSAGLACGPDPRDDRTGDDHRRRSPRWACSASRSTC